MEPISATISPSQKKALETLAEQKEVSVSDVLRRALEIGLAHLMPRRSAQ